MQNLRLNIFVVLMALLLSTLSGCQIVNSQGKQVEPLALQRLEKEKLTKSQVEELIGSPTIVPDYTTNTWYYVERLVAKRAWFNQKTIHQKILKLSFDKNGILIGALVLDDGHDNDIKIVREYTKSNGTNLNPMQKFVKNIGRFSVSKKEKKAKKLMN